MRYLEGNANEHKFEVNNKVYTVNVADYSVTVKEGTLGLGPEPWESDSTLGTILLNGFEVEGFDSTKTEYSMPSEADVSTVRPARRDRRDASPAPIRKSVSFIWTFTRMVWRICIWAVRMRTDITATVVYSPMMVRTGASVVDAIRFGSYNLSKLVGFTDRGEIKRGLRADLVIVDRRFNMKKVILKGVVRK